MIEVKNIVKRYGLRNVVDDLSFTVEKGQIVGFLGPNGAGKSTTMNIITGYISATSGTVVVNGHDVFEEPEEVKKCIGYLPEQPPLYPDMKVIEYLNFVSDLKGVKSIDRDKSVGKAMKLTKIKDVSERLIKHLSKGYKQRVGLAGALIGDPEILILDEPTVGLDPKQIIEIRSLIVELSKSHTILLSSHIMQEVNAVCNKIVIINQGKLVLCDTPDSIQSQANGANELKMTIKGQKAVVQNIVDKLENVSFAKVKQAEGADTCDVSISTPTDVDVREDIFFLCAQKECPILYMNQKVPTLEEVFIKLTGEGTKQYGSNLSKEQKKKMKEKLKKGDE